MNCKYVFSNISDFLNLCPIIGWNMFSSRYKMDVYSIITVGNVIIEKL